MQIKKELRAAFSEKRRMITDKTEKTMLYAAHFLTVIFIIQLMKYFATAVSEVR